MPRLPPTHLLPSIIAVALLLPLTRATFRTPRLSLSPASAPHIDSSPESLPSTLRLSTPALCPLQDRSCSTLCCPSRCCPSALPFCLSSSTHSVCVSSTGTRPCQKSGRPGTPCVAADAAGFPFCCATAPFNHCAADPPFACVSSDGFVGCGDDNAPGVACLDGGCCNNPFKCCPGGCCKEGDGGPRNVEKLNPPAPANTPLPPGTSRRPLPTPSTVPTPTPIPSTVSTPTPTESMAPPDNNVGDGMQSTVESPKLPVSENQRSCFPSTATAELEDGTFKNMAELATGDRVRVSASEFSSVYMWTHRDAQWKGDNFVALMSAEGQQLIASIGHMIYVCRGILEGCEKEVSGVENVRRGDGIIVLEKGRTRVVRVSDVVRVASKGLYNPQTLHGDIVVNGVLATCYTKAVPMRTAHGLLAPLRGLYELLEHMRRIGERSIASD